MIKFNDWNSVDRNQRRRTEIEGGAIMIKENKDEMKDFKMWQTYKYDVQHFYILGY